jgi:hypothetical protein
MVLRQGQERSRVATYCFAEGKHALFTESVLRGYLATVLDWPRRKPYEEYVIEANQVPDEMRRDVCCIPAENDYPYRHLIVTGWVAAYRCLDDDGISERVLALAKTIWKQQNSDESLAFLRSCLADLQPIIDSTWAQYLAFLQSGDDGPVQE